MNPEKVTPINAKVAPKVLSKTSAPTSNPEVSYQPGFMDKIDAEIEQRTQPNLPNLPATVTTTNASSSDSGIAKPRSSVTFVTLAELEKICHEEPPRYIVEGLLPSDDVHVAVGDSVLIRHHGPISLVYASPLELRSWDTPLSRAKSSITI